MSGKSGSGVPTRIVVGTDASETAERAVNKPAALAKAVGAELIIISAFNNRAPAGVAAAGISIDSGWVAAAQDSAESVAREAAERAKSDGVASVSYQAVAGEPSVELDYAVVVHADDLEPARTCAGSRPLRLLIAAEVGPVRLIDNLDPHQGR